MLSQICCRYLAHTPDSNVIHNYVTLLQNKAKLSLVCVLECLQIIEAYNLNRGAPAQYQPY